MSEGVSATGVPAQPGVQKARRLGRGLASLMSSTRIPTGLEPSAGQTETPATIGSYEPVSLAVAPAAEQARPPGGQPIEIPVSDVTVNPYQPRRTFAEADLAELTESVRRQGVLQPLLVASPKDANTSSYVLIAGERRLRAATAAGLKSVPCVVKSATPEQMLEWALIENVQRSDLNPVEKALAYRDYMDRFSASQQQLADQLGQPRSSVANCLRILDVCDEVQQMLLEGSLSFGHAKVLAGLAGQMEKQIALAGKVLEQNLSVRQLEDLVAQGVGDGVASPAPSEVVSHKSQHIKDLELQISRAVGTKVVIKPGRSKHTGKIVVEYYSLDDFERIANSLGARLES